MEPRVRKILSWFRQPSQVQKKISYFFRVTHVYTHNDIGTNRRGCCYICIYTLKHVDKEKTFYFYNMKREHIYMCIYHIIRLSYNITYILYIPYRIYFIDILYNMYIVGVCFVYIHIHTYTQIYICVYRYYTQTQCVYTHTHRHIYTPPRIPCCKSKMSFLYLRVYSLH